MLPWQLAPAGSCQSPEASWWGLGLGGILSIVLTGTQSMNTGVPVVLAGIAIGLGAGMIAAALIGTERSRDA